MNITKGTKGFISVPLMERMEAKIERMPSGCWKWRGSRAFGYGLVWANGRVQRAHRVMWELHHGKPFPEGMDACHSCDNPPCVNPAHIWPGTPSMNAKDAVRKGHVVPPNKPWQRGMTHCKRGHEFTAENTIRTSQGNRSCRICQRMHGTRYDHKRRKPSPNRQALKGE